MTTEATVSKRRKETLKLETQLLEQLKLKLNLHKDTWIRLSNNSLELGILKAKNSKERLFASEISFYNSTNWENPEKDNLEINFGSSGSFTPNDLAPTIRTRHAMEFLSNWEESTTLILLFMNQLKNLNNVWRLENEINELNK